jgi:branched-chain amino acid transport system ATP-binding protein
MESKPILAVSDLHAWYGSGHVLQGVTLEVHPGEIVSLIGRNGAGKTTTLKSIMGLMARISGQISLEGMNITRQPAHERFHLGLGYVPEDRRIVPGLTVLENIRLGLLASPLRAREAEIIEEMAETFPRLKQRLGQAAATLSGGEQQMLAIARAMVSRPKIILLDEPSEGIMPVLVDEMFELFARWKGQGRTILLVEQSVERALTISDRAYIIDQGQIVHHDVAATLLQDPRIQEQYCSV